MRHSGRRLAALLFALGIPAAVALLLLFSLGVVRQILPQVQTILLLPKPRPEPVVIDARQPPRPRTPAPAAAPASPAPLPAYATTSPGLSITPPRDTVLLQDMTASFNNCGKAADRAACPPPIAPPDPRSVTLGGGGKVKDEERWAEEKRRGESTDLGVAVGPGIGFVIRDPLCKLAWVMLGGGFRCGAPASGPRRYTDAQFEAARQAYQRRRGSEPRAAPASPAEQGK